LQVSTWFTKKAVFDSKISRFLFQAFLSGPFTTWKRSQSLSSKSFVTESMKFQYLACKETGQAQQKKVDMWKKKLSSSKTMQDFMVRIFVLFFYSQKNTVTVTCINCEQVTPNGFRKGSFATMDRCSAAFSEQVSSELPTSWHNRTKKTFCKQHAVKSKPEALCFKQTKQRPWKSNPSQFQPFATLWVEVQIEQCRDISARRNPLG